MTAPLSIECIQTTKDLDRLAPVWNGLLETSASNSLFLTWEWISTWWEVFGPRFSLLTLVARDDGGVVRGIAPLMIGPGSGRAGKRLRHLMVIGQQGDTAAEYLDFIVEKGREPDVTPAFCRHLLHGLGRSWDVLRFDRVLADSPNLPILEGELRAAGRHVERPRAEVSPYADISRGFEAFLGAKSSGFRKQYRYRISALERQEPVEILTVGRDLDVDEAMDRLIQLNRARWGEEGESFKTAAYVAFHRTLARKMLGKGRLLFIFLKVGGRLAAARYDFKYADKLWCFQGGWLPDYEKVSIGQTILGHSIRLAAEAGCREYDFLAGEAEYKRRWGTGERRLLDVQCFNKTWRAQAYRLARWTRDRLRGWGRAKEQTPTAEAHADEPAAGALS